MSSLPLSIGDIEAARERIAGAVIHTPCVPAPQLREISGTDLVVKYENFQVTNAFKERGAANRLALLDPGLSDSAASWPCRLATTPRRWHATPRC